MPSIEDTLFQLKFSTKQLERFSKKCEKEQKVQESKVKKALMQKNVEGAQIYAENAIRKKNESLNFLRLASRLDAVASRVQSAMMMKQVMVELYAYLGVCSDTYLGVCSNTYLGGISATMEKFEGLFEDLDVNTQVMEGSMGAATTLTTPQDQVEALINQVAEENGLEVIKQLDAVQPGTASLRDSERSTEKEDQLSRRLAALRN
ncbi:predicted protein [Nematostella vectensis]|uniref:Charged multivesicular body protein 1a n=1 Tax=Nematostella vectensis TaxID=45351 RepID=A7SQW1_NEMVE|nr:predicted protein [Nematostella vectensis]|eukprot:XP_001626010.1 predicted protein [Nematostella vectensis]